MIMNLYSAESQMLQRREEIEQAAASTWQETNQIQLFTAMITKFKAVANTQTHLQTQAACCSCC
ncbi:hypothetical protein [Paenibacillus hexagrammi]|uniref:Uncharacterized protein n=1 Tax=Paenibacillus hexagrammi TaxID=2908839 RepID=A0ABY3SD11_9BACL|nr:hypothetical protein [Paenibacillus sp. YPD9-1]UJF31879.1 hypothetical protein L0M14_19240 [Paenibacillus sp. YPD9-1]